MDKYNGLHQHQVSPCLVSGLSDTRPRYHWTRTTVHQSNPLQVHLRRNCHANYGHSLVERARVKIDHGLVEFCHCHETFRNKLMLLYAMSRGREKIRRTSRRGFEITLSQVAMKMSDAYLSSPPRLEDSGWNVWLSYTIYTRNGKCPTSVAAANTAKELLRGETAVEIWLPAQVKSSSSCLSINGGASRICGKPITTGYIGKIRRNSKCWGCRSSAIIRRGQQRWVAMDASSCSLCN